MNRPKAVKRNRQQSTLDFFLESRPPLSQGQNEEEIETITKRPCDSNTESDSVPIANDQQETVAGENTSNQSEHCSQTGHVPGPGVSPLDISGVLISGNISDSEKVNFLENCWKPAPFDILDNRCFAQNKRVVFQAKWLEKRKWLAYSAHKDFKGGWCLPCPLFLTDREKESLGAFVKTPFNNYNKSKELLDAHESKGYHQRSCERACIIRIQLVNVATRIDAQVNQQSLENINRNTTVLPFIVDAVVLCAKQQIALRGHRDDKINFSEPAVSNEGNFIAIIRVLAEQNPVLKEYLVSGSKNAKHTSKTVQNELISTFAELIRDYFRSCLGKSRHFALIADESTSNGREVLSVCLRLLDFIAEPLKPTKREVLIDLCDLSRTTGEAIATAIRSSLESHRIDLLNCCGQAYDTTACMSSDAKGVQAHISKYAPNADYQGCCLHSLNLVICHACKISSIQNMMDSCRELFSFFDNSPKRQNFLEVIIDALAPDIVKKRKLKNLCKTRWIERHTAFETIFSLYEYIVITLNEVCNSSRDEQFYPNNEEWNWDGETKAKANGLRHTFTNFGHIVCFVCAKDMLEPMLPLVSALQGELMEVYFGFQKIDQVTDSYQDIRTDVDSWFTRMYSKTLILAALVGSSEQRPRICSRQQNRENYPSNSVADYWKRSVVVPFLDVICAELTSRFSEDKRAHYELCALIPAVIAKKSPESVVALGKTLMGKWSNIMPISSGFDSELFRWYNLCRTNRDALAGVSSSITSMLAEGGIADGIFFPNVRELLVVLAVLPIGSTEAERSFSCLRRLHTWLRSAMTTKRLSDLALIAMHGFTVPITNQQILDSYVAAHPRRMQALCLLDD